MNITDEMVEAAARAMVPLMEGAQEDEMGRDLPESQYHDLPDDWKAAYKRYARAALEAVLPMLTDSAVKAERGAIIKWLRERLYDTAADGVERKEHLK